MYRMIKNHTAQMILKSAFLMISLIFLNYSYVQAQDIEIQYLANQGVLISDSNTTIYVDGIFEDEFEAFDHLPKDSLKKVWNNVLDQNKKSFILVSHLHRDHFGSDLTGKFLQSDRNALFISPQETADKFRDDYADFNKINEQVKTLPLSTYEYEALEFDKIKITIINLPHLGESPWKEAVNYAYIIEINGKKILHLGDAKIDESSLKALAFPDLNLDIAIMHIGQMASVEQKELIDQYIAPKQLMAAHIPLSYYDTAQSLLKDIGYDEVIIFNTPLKKYTF